VEENVVNALRPIYVSAQLSCNWPMCLAVIYNGVLCYILYCFVFVSVLNI
jgi:hypothetical protein